MIATTIAPRGVLGKRSSEKSKMCQSELSKDSNLKIWDRPMV